MRPAREVAAGGKVYPYTIQIADDRTVLVLLWRVLEPCFLLVFPRYVPT